MAERLSNLGYLGLVKEAVVGTPLTPTDWVPMYDETMSTMFNLVEDMPVVGNKAARYQVVPGQRGHKGDVTVLHEPNTFARLLDMLLTKTSTSGAGPYTHTFAPSATTNPNSYTVDISTGNVVFRFWGVGMSKMTQMFDKNEARLKCSLSALGAFYGREILSVTGVGPYTITFKTDYDPNPAKGLVVGDLIRTTATTGGATIDAVVATVDAAFQYVTCVANVSSNTAGDMLTLRPSTPTLNLLPPSFLWSKTNFQFAGTSAAALSAAQTRLEQGSIWEIMHKFEKDEGSDRSGALDPASLVRTVVDGTIKGKRFFDTPDQILNINSNAKVALTVRMYNGSTNQYEARIIYNNLKLKDKVKPDTKVGSIYYSDIDYLPQWDNTDGAILSAVAVNGLAII